MSTPLNFAASIWETGRLWQNGLAVVPVALAVAAICRWAPCRPATRHLLWLVVLLVLLVPTTWIGARAGDAAAGGAAWVGAQATGAWGRAARWLTDKPPDERAQNDAPPVLSRAQARATRGDTPGAATGAPAPAVPAVPPVGPPSPVARGPLPAPPAPARTADPGPGRRGEAIRTPAADAPPARPGLFQTGDQIFPPPPPVAAIAAPRPFEPLAPAVPQIRVPLDRDAPGAAPPRADPTEPRAGAVAGAPRSSGPTGQWGERLVALRDAVVALPPVPGAVWAGGVAALVLVGGLRTWSQRRVLGRATRAPDDVRRVVASAAAVLGLSGPPETLMVSDRISPMVWCGLKRRLLLPRELWAELDEAGRQAVVMHELAHLRRKDHWTCWAELIACTIYWWHPIAWWVRRRLRDEADLCCDAWVTALFPADRRVYAQALLETRKYISRPRWIEPAVGLSATAGGAKRFARRLTMVMTHRTKPGGSWAGVALAAALAGAGMASGPLWACPPDGNGKQAEAGAPVEAAAPAVAPPTTAASAAPAALSVAAVPAVAPDQPAEQDRSDSTFERYMAGRDRPNPVSADLEALLEAAGERLDRLDERLGSLRGLFESVGTPATPAPDAAPAQHECGDDCNGGCACNPCDESCAGPCGGKASGAADEPQGAGTLVLVVSGDGRVQVYRLPEERTDDLMTMLDEADGPVVVQPGARVAVNGADVSQLVATEVRQRAARSRAVAQALRAASRERVDTTVEVYRRQAEAYQLAAEQTREKSEQMRKRATEMEQRAREMSESAPSLSRSQRRRAEADAERFSRQNEEMQNAAQSMNDQAEELAEKARELAEEAQAAAQQDEADAQDASDEVDSDDEAPEAQETTAEPETTGDAAAPEAQTTDDASR